jgi:periplasmic divalent cation tolerance protein
MLVIVLVTCQDVAEGERIADNLLRERLAACVNIVPGVRSKFWWTGKIHDAEEVVLLIKTRKNLLRELIRKVKSVHQYENPEIIALPVIGGSKEYTKWIDNETK